MSLSSEEKSRKVLLVEPRNELNQKLSHQIEHETGWKVLHVESLQAALERIAVMRGQLKIVIVTINGNVGPVKRFLQQVARLAAIQGTRRPRTLLLSQTRQRPEIADCFEKMGAHLCLRYQDQVLDIVKRFQWQSRATPTLPTLVVERRAGHVAALFLKYDVATQEVHGGPRLRALAEHLVVHAKTAHSTEMLADALGVCKQSVKEYILRLRYALDHACHQLGIGLSGQQIVWTRKLPGGFVHGLTANVEIEDVPEFYAPESRPKNLEALSQQCAVCKLWYEDSEITWSHLGWLCVNCCKDLLEAGEVA